MPRGRTSLFVGLGVLVLALLLAAAYLIGRGQAGGAPISAATTRPTPVASTPTPTATPVQTPTTPPTQGSGGTRPTPTPVPTGQTVLSFDIPRTITCDANHTSTPNVHLAWTTANAKGVVISIDGPGPYANYPANGSADVPFACSEAQHTYLITTQGSGTPATRTVVVKRAG